MRKNISKQIFTLYVCILFNILISSYFCKSLIISLSNICANLPKISCDFIIMKYIYILLTLIYNTIYD